MDVKPKSNKLKRQETARKRARVAERRLEESVRAGVTASARAAEDAVRDWKAVRHDPAKLVERVCQGETVRLPATSELRVIADLFAGLRPGRLCNLPLRPDVGALRRLVLLCWKRTGMLRGREASRYGDALVALCAHGGRWVRAPEDWKPRSHNAYWQFHSLVHHLTTRYDVPVFMNSAWLEGLTAAGVVHQRWFLDVAQGKNIRACEGLPVPLTKKQAHFYLEAPADFDVLSAFRWAQVVELGGDDRLVRSILRTRVGTDFTRDEFWVGVFRWLVEHPMLDAVHHGPILDYLHNQKFVATALNPRAGRPGEPRLLAPQPNLTMKGRNPETLLAAVNEWHRRLGRDRTARPTAWAPCGLPAFRHEEGTGAARRVYTIEELLSSRALDDEGRAMSHCVGSYAASCASGRTAIWSLKETDDVGQETRLLTLEVTVGSRQIVQARRRFNALPTQKELSLVGRWAGAGGPALSKWLAR
jgi:hypothetical protein